MRQAEVRLAHLEPGGDDADESPGRTDEPGPDLDEAALAIAQVQLVRALAMLERQRALADAARVVFRRATLRSPVDGLVLERSIEVGEMVSTNAASRPLFVIGSDPSRLRLVASIDELDVAEVRPRSVEFTTPAFPDRRFRGTIVGLWPASAQRRSPTEYQVLAEVANDDFTLWPGLSVRVRLPAHSAPRVRRVPIEALAFSPPGVPALAEGRPAVWVLRDGKPERIPVAVGITGEALAEIVPPP